jgi:hypothetical protein
MGHSVMAQDHIGSVLMTVLSGELNDHVHILINWRII